MAISSPKNHNKKPQNKKNPLYPQQKQSTLSFTSKSPKSPKIRVVGGQIYDPENRKICHQCRQKRADLVLSCNKAGNKICNIKFCHKCLLNRYGEKAEEVVKLGVWKCPKCRGICNCSRCRKRKGPMPTGMLTAKATGYSSVMEMLLRKGPDGLSVDKDFKDACTSPNKLTVSSKELAASKRKRGKENSKDGDSNIQYKHFPVNEDAKSESKKIASKKVRPDNLNADTSKGNGNNGVIKRKGLQTHISKNVDVGVPNNEENINKIEFHKLKENVKTSCEEENADAMLPKGNDLVNVAGIELPGDDIGPALQFLEFCTAFQRVLALKKGQAESILRELTRGRVMRRGVHSSIVQFHIKLLSLIRKDLGEVRPLSNSTSSGNSWLQVLGKCISESRHAPKGLALDCHDRQTDGYDKLGSSEKLKVLNFLCDETLGTKKMRSYMDQQHTKYVESKKEAKEKILAAKANEKLMRQKLKDETQVMLSTRNDAHLSISEHDDLVSKIKNGADKAHADVLEAMNMVPKTIEQHKMDAVRTEPILLDGNGQVYWKLRGHSRRSCILHQEIGNWDYITHQDKWFTYDDEQEKAVDKYIFAMRERTHRAKVLTPLWRVVAQV